MACHPYTYPCTVGTRVRRRDLERRLRALGWHLLRHGRRHDVWTDGVRLEYVPRHAEIHEALACKILRKAASGMEGDE